MATAKPVSSAFSTKQSRFMRQADSLLKSGKKLSTAQKQTYDRLTNQKWYNDYGSLVQSGKNNTANVGKYNELATKNNWIKAGVNNDTLHNMSIKALSGDKNAQAYMKAMNLKGQTGAALWNGVTTDQLGANKNLRTNYVKDNPYADYTKQYDMKNYKTYSDRIANHEAMSPEQMAWYNNAASKWSLQNGNDPYVQQQQTYEKDKQTALNAQDTALNQGFAQQDANNFQQFQQLSQNMGNRGLGDSGIAADAYMRSQMAANQNYQQAFSDTATNKSDIQAKYNEAISNSKISGQEYKDAKAAQDAELAAVNTKNEQDYDLGLKEQQNEQDKYLTTATGTVYVGGKQLLQNGKPVTTLEWSKLSETQRHNIASENNTATKNAMTYELGATKNEIAADANAVKRQQIAATLQVALKKNELDYAKLDYNYAALESTNATQQEQIKIAIANAQTAKDKTQLTALSKQSNAYLKKITAAQKAGKKPSKKDVDGYNKTNKAINTIISGKNFKGTPGGSDSTLGSLSARYESSGNIATIARTRGDLGGASYGKYQITQNSGNATKFANQYGGQLKGKKAGTAAFDAAWRAEAKKDPKRFENAQHDFVGSTHYQPAVRGLNKAGINLSSYPKAVQDVIWSVAVQHGAGGAVTLFKRAGIKKGDSAETVINKVYNERSKVEIYFRKSPANIRASVKRRFISERRDALNMLRK